MERKIAIYQVLCRIFGNSNTTNSNRGTITENGVGKFKDFSTKALSDISKMGFTHIWLTGVIAHASKTDYTKQGIPKEYSEIIKGEAGSPYAIRDYYDVDPDLATKPDKRMLEFESLILRSHKKNLKIIIDFVPNHLARSYSSTSKSKEISDFGENDDCTLSFNPNNNFYYIPDKKLDLSRICSPEEITYEENPARATGNDCFSHTPSTNDWYETVKLNYGVDYRNGRAGYFDPIPDTWNKMLDILLFWSSKKIDGFRCDMAEMVPVEFWNWVVPKVKEKFPHIIFIGEVYNIETYRLFLEKGYFDYLYDKEGLYDTLRNVVCHDKPTSDISFALNNVGDIQAKMLNFMENHDEQRLASDFFCGDGRKGFPAMFLSATINTNPVMVYFGQELGERGMDIEGFSGQDGRTTIFDYWCVDTIKRWNNNGKWDTSLLSEEEKNLKEDYSSLINLCTRRKTLTKGLFYDLMYANYENKKFNSCKHFAFLRGDSIELDLVVINFNNSENEIKVYIPIHALNFYKLTNKRITRAEAQFSPEKITIIETEDEYITISLTAYSGEIIKLSFV